MDFELFKVQDFNSDCPLAFNSDYFASILFSKLEQTVGSSGGSYQNTGAPDFSIHYFLPSTYLLALALISIQVRLLPT
jgi:hypothetical protein